MASTSLSDFDLHLLAEGTNYRAYRTLGAHLTEADGVAGVRFAVWAPNAGRVAVIGDWNGWDPVRHPLQGPTASGVWHTFVPGVAVGNLYKYRIEARDGGYRADKADPYGFAAQVRPETASRVVDLEGHRWGDHEWLSARASRRLQDQPLSIYEVHLGSWRRRPEEGNRWLSYRELASELGDYIQQLGFTHVELLPVSEHPFDGSWGYQPTGYFAATSRFGTPHDLMYLIDQLHQRGIGVILDWVPAHFPRDEHGLGFFDGTHLYEHADPRQGLHPDWDTLVFNYGRNEVRSLLISNALFWFDYYHVDALRVDAVASMLYLDYGRADRDWVPNQYGGRENLEAVQFLRVLNEQVHGEYPGVTVIAEESTSWPAVSRPTYLGGLGFGFKWNMGWMHDMLTYMGKDPVHRSHHHHLLTFSLMYAFSENFVLPFSHDEVVHLKGSMLSRMPGDEWQKFANLRLLYGYLYGHPGKKLLFMGGEFGQWGEWNHDQSLDWHLLDRPLHRGLQTWLADLNRLYRSEPALFQRDSEPDGFEWIDCTDAAGSTVSFLRCGREGRRLLCVANFTPMLQQHYRVGVPTAGRWTELLNSDAAAYGGGGHGNLGGVESTGEGAHGRPASLDLVLPPLGFLVLREPGPAR